MPRKKPNTYNETELFALKTLVASALTEAAKDKDFIDKVINATKNVMRTFGYTEKQINDALIRYITPEVEDQQPALAEKE